MSTPIRETPVPDAARMESIRRLVNAVSSVSAETAEELLAKIDDLERMRALDGDVLARVLIAEDSLRAERSLNEQLNKEAVNQQKCIDTLVQEGRKHQAIIDKLVAEIDAKHAEVTRATREQTQLAHELASCREQYYASEEACKRQASSITAVMGERDNALRNVQMWRNTAENNQEKLTQLDRDYQANVITLARLQVVVRELEEKLAVTQRAVTHQALEVVPTHEAKSAELERQLQCVIHAARKVVKARDLLGPKWLTALTPAESYLENALVFLKQLLASDGAYNRAWAVDLYRAMELRSLAADVVFASKAPTHTLHTCKHTVLWDSAEDWAEDWAARNRVTSVVTNWLTDLARQYEKRSADTKATYDKSDKLARDAGKPLPDADE